MNIAIEIFAAIGLVSVLFSFCCLAAVMVFIIEDYVYSRRAKNEARKNY